MEMDLNNRLTEDETLEQAYDIFLELAVDNLDPADVILFNLQFEERGGAELFDGGFLAGGGFDDVGTADEHLGGLAGHDAAS